MLLLLSHFFDWNCAETMFDASYVYWTVHHLDSWIKIDQLMSLVLLFHYLLLNMFQMLIHPSSGACELLWIYFMCCIALVRCVLVLRCGSAGWCGILMQAEAVLHYLLLNMFWMLVHPSSGACDLLWIYFMCCIALVRCVLVIRCGSAGVVWYPYAGWSLHKDEHMQAVATVLKCRTKDTQSHL